MMNQSIPGKSGGFVKKTLNPIQKTFPIAQPNMNSLKSASPLNMKKLQMIQKIKQIPRRSPGMNIA